MRRLALALGLLLATDVWAGSSRSFDGSTDDISIAGTPIGSFSTPWTIAAWFNWDGGSSNGLIYGEGRAAQSTPFLGLGINYSTAKARAYARGDDNANKSFDGTTTISSGTWYHAAMVFDGTTLTLYLDGSSEGTATPTAALTLTTRHIGKLRRPTSSNYFGGEIGEVLIYGRELDIGEVQELARGKSDGVPGGAVGHWSLRESGVSPTFVDLSGNGNSGTNNGSIESSDGPPVSVGSQ